MAPERPAADLEIEAVALEQFLQERRHGSQASPARRTSWSFLRARGLQRSAPNLVTSCRISASLNQASLASCWPLPDFGIDVHGEGLTVGLRPTGPENIKPLLEQELGMARALAQ